MLTLTSPHKTWAHSLPAGAKLAALCLWTGLVLHLTGLSLWLASATVLALVATGGSSFATSWGRMLRPLWPFAAIVLVWQLWIGQPIGAVTVLLRMAATVGLANAVTMTTQLAEIIAVITWLTQPLQRVGLSPKVLALSVALMIRFIPVMLLRFDQIANAWAARSPRKPGWRILVPTLLAALDDADRVAEALRARGGVG